MTTIQQPKMVTLCDGTSVPRLMVRPTYLQLRTLRRSNPAALEELANAARDPGYQLTDARVARVLKAHGLITAAGIEGHARIHPLVRSVILAAITADGRVQDPIPEGSR